MVLQCSGSSLISRVFFNEDGKARDVYACFYPGTNNNTSNNNGTTKKMSLEEFLGNDTLGESVWDEEDINLDAISNTTNIDILKQTKAGGEHQRDGHQQGPHGSQGPMGRSRFPNSASFGGGNMGDFANHHHPLQQQQQQQGPPYIVKFSDLPPRFSNFDIEDLFQAKFTKFIKFKLFWEVNKNPSISTLKSGSVFDQNFKHDSKVAFVELYSSRDMDKILNYWTTPLKEIYHITIAPAEFDDFKDYSAKVKLLTDPKDDAGKPFIVKTQRSKSNPFGSARPVDTQSKILDIEEKMENLHVEDTTTLRASLVSDSDGKSLATPAPTTAATAGVKITILKKQPLTGEESTSTTPTPKPLSYSEVVERSVVNETSKKSTPLSKIGTPASDLQSTDKSDNFEGDDRQGSEKYENDKIQSDASGGNGIDADTGKQFTFKNVERDQNTGRTKYNGNQNNSNNGNFRGNNRYRGGANSGNYRGGNSNRGNRGGNRGGNSYNNNNNTGDDDNNNNTNNTNNNGSRYHDRQNNGDGAVNSESTADATGHNSNDFSNSVSNTQQYSIFKPASGFLGQSNNDSMRNSGRGNYSNNGGMNGASRGRGSGRGRGFGRGTYNNRGGRGGRGNNRGYSNYNSNSTDTSQRS